MPHSDFWYCTTLHADLSDYLKCVFAKGASSAFCFPKSKGREALPDMQCVPDIVLGTLHILPNLIRATAKWVRRYHHHFTKEETTVQRGPGLCPSSLLGGARNWNPSFPGSWAHVLSNTMTPFTLVYPRILYMQSKLYCVFTFVPSFMSV